MFAAMLWAALPHGADATGAEPATVPQVDAAPCFAAAVANEDDKIVVAGIMGRYPYGGVEWCSTCPTGRRARSA